MGSLELLLSFLAVYGALYLAAVLLARLVRRGRRRRQLRLSALLALVAASALAFRAVLYPDRSLTVEVRNLSGRPLREVVLARDDEAGRVALGTLDPRSAASRDFRPPPPGRWAVRFRREGAGQAEVVPILFPRDSRIRDYRLRVNVGPQGTSLHVDWSRRPYVPFR